VPGAAELSPMEDLLAVWKVAERKRFQNYRASLTVLDAAKIPRAWLNEIKSGTPLSNHCPKAWKSWVEAGSYRPLKAERATEYRGRKEQIPSDDKSLKIIRIIYERFKASPIAFEACAAKIAQLMDKKIVALDLTRPSRDGRDAVGLYRIGVG